MEAMEALHSSKALQSIGAAKESAATRASMMPEVVAEEEAMSEAEEDAMHSLNPDDMAFEAFAPVGGVSFAPSKSAPRPSLASATPNPSFVQKPVQPFEAMRASETVQPSGEPEVKEKRPRKDTKAAEQIVAKAQDCIDKMKSTHAPEKLWSNPPRARTGSRSVMSWSFFWCNKKLP